MTRIATGIFYQRDAFGGYCFCRQEYESPDGTKRKRKPPARNPAA